MPNNPNLSKLPSEQPPEFIKLLANDVRWGLLKALTTSDYQVNELVAQLQQPMNLVSYHLKKLRDDALVTTRRSEADGRDVYYSLDLDRLRQLYQAAGSALHPLLSRPYTAVDELALPPLRVLVVCTHNSARSQMAEGLLRQLSKGQIAVFSAGSQPTRVHPDAVRVMEALGIDLRGQITHHLRDYEGQPFDYVITVCDKAREVCPTFPGDGRRLHWGFPDPVVIEAEAQRIAAFEEIAYRLHMRIRQFLTTLRQDACEDLFLSDTLYFQKIIVDLITLFGDIHGNLPALEAVFQDIEARRLTNLYCLGDLVGYGTFPNEVVTFIRERHIATLMGNYDQGVGNNSDDCGCAYKVEIDRKRGELSIAWSNAHTTDDNKAYLRALPAHIPVQLGDLQVLLVHGSPRKVNEYMFEDRPDAYFERILDAAKVDVIVCGHTHLPYHKILPSGRQIINTGSVGKPKDHDPRAGYVVLSASGRDLKVDFIRVPYDIERTAQAIEATPEIGGMPHPYAQMLREGAG